MNVAVGPPRGSPKPSVPASRAGELESSRLGVIFFLGKLQVDFSAEEASKDLATSSLGLLAGSGGNAAAIVEAGAAAAAIPGRKMTMVEEIGNAIQKWLVRKFNVAPDDARLAVHYVQYNLPSLILGIQSAVGDTGAITGPTSSGVTTIATGLYTAITKTIEFFDLRHAGTGVALEAGHPDLIAESIKSSVAKAALAGLGEAALAAAKATLAAVTHGVGAIINKVAGVIEQLLRFAVRFCDALSLSRVFADARRKWTAYKQPDAIQTRPEEFAQWFGKMIDRSAVVAALVMNCGIAGDAMSFLQVLTGPGEVITQGQFDKGVTYLNALKSSASDLIQDAQDSMKIWSADQMVAARLKHAGEIGLVQKEASSSWRAKLFAWSNQGTKKSQALSWVLSKAGFRQSTALRA